MNSPSPSERSQQAGKAYVPHPPLTALPMGLGRCRLYWGTLKYLAWSARNGHFYGVKTALLSLIKETVLVVKDAFGAGDPVECNICGWRGSAFYPLVGSGYFELNRICPRCLCIHRYRTLVAVLDVNTQFFAPGKEVIEVAPMKTFQAYCLWRKRGKSYRSFDMERFAMEKGDITAMRYGDGSCDYFLCFHVLEHVPADVKAMKEILRVLRPGGLAVMQVPIDHSLRDNVEYGRPNPFETGHVRRYSDSGFAARLTSEGFTVKKICPAEVFNEADIQRFGLDREAIYFASKPG